LLKKKLAVVRATLAVITLKHKVTAPYTGGTDMGDFLERGLQTVRKACDADYAGKHVEALPLYQEAIVLFKSAYNSMC